MGLMERKYMGHIPEERKSDISPELKQFRDHQKEMYVLHAKGNSMTAKDKQRLEELYELNRQYITTGKMNLNYTRPNKTKKKNKYLPLLIFTLVILALVFVLTYYPELLGV